MRRRVLLIEPNYKAKYPPLHLMKLSRYYREICKDDVRFFKGKLEDYPLQLLIEEFFESAKEDYAPVESDLKISTTQYLCNKISEVTDYVKNGKSANFLNVLPELRRDFYKNALENFHDRFINKDYPTFDIICVGTLFTFAWTKTIDTINYAKRFLAKGGKIYVGGIAASLVPNDLKAETGITPHLGLLDKPSDLDKKDDVIIDTLNPDYSILEETDFQYHTNDAYFGYTTRGCIRKCDFCAVSTLEPDYKNYVDIREQLKQLKEQFGEKQYLMLMDNNVFASPDFNKIIDDIKECGFEKGAKYNPANQYEVAIKNLSNDFNVRGYVRKIIKLYDALNDSLPKDKAANFYSERAKKHLLHYLTATKKNIFAFDEIAKPLFANYFKRSQKPHYIDFNQGLDARLVNEENMSKIAQINILPLRIAFDHYEQRDTYEKAIRMAAKYGITHMSNYILYNFRDKPDDFYYRLRINIDLCEELNIAIYSFPMKYAPIRDPEYFRNRNYLGRHWNRKFIRSIQAVINATQGKIGRGRSFFNAAFGNNIEEFHDILWMPEPMIIYRHRFKDFSDEWCRRFHSLDEQKFEEAKEIIKLNRFKDEDILKAKSKEVRELLRFYQIEREDVDKITLQDFLQGLKNDPLI